MSLIDTSIRRPVLTTTLILMVAVLGVFSFSKLPVEFFPPIEFPMVTISTVYPGAGSEEIETLVSKPIEEAVGTVKGIKNIESSSQDGISLVMAEFHMGTDIDVAAADILAQINRAKSTLPEDAKDPVVIKFDIGAMPVMDLTVRSKHPLEDIYIASDKVIKKELEKISEVGSVNIVGGKEREILVKLDREKLRMHSVSILNVIEAISRANLDVPSGHITQERSEYMLRLTGKFQTLNELRNLKVKGLNKDAIPLTSIGKVQDSFKEMRELARYNEEPVVGISIQKRSEANTVKLSEKVRKTIVGLKKRLPDYKIEVVTDRATFIKGSVSMVKNNITIGIILTALLLFLFLHTFSGTIIATIVMPVAIISTFIPLLAFGFTINFMSLMGIALSVGILVNNSILVLENTYRHLELGNDSKTAASAGTSEIAIAVFSSTMTNIVVFLPIAFMSGIVGQMFRQFALTIAFATLFSLLVSFTLTPMMASVMLRSVGNKENKTGLLANFFARWDNLFVRFREGYRKLLIWSLKRRTVILLSAGALFIATFLLFPLIGFEMMPQTDEGYFTVDAELPVGTTLSQTDQTMKQIEQTVFRTPEVKGLYTTLGKVSGTFSGSTGVNIGQLKVELIDREKRKRTTEEVVEALRHQLAKVPGITTLTIKAVSGMEEGEGEAPIQIQITGENLAELHKLAQRVKQKTEETTGTVDVDLDWRMGKPELVVEPDREKMAKLGITVAQMAQILRSSFEGEVTGTYSDGGEEYDIRVRLDLKDRANPADVGKIILTTSQDKLIPLSEVAQISRVAGPTRIARKNYQRMIKVSSFIGRGSLGKVVQEIKRSIKDISLPAGYNIHYGGEVEWMEESFRDLFIALILAVVLTYLILAGILESFLQPFIIMLTLPLALIGIFWTLFLTGKTISILTLMAMVMLVGLVVNNAILLLDYIKVLRSSGKGRDEAILEACPIRLRPIVMANLSTIIAMIPLALGFGFAGAMRSPMALVIIGGIIASGGLALLIIPVVYTLFDDLISKVKKRVKS